MPIILKIHMHQTKNIMDVIGLTSIFIGIIGIALTIYFGLKK